MVLPGQISGYKWHEDGKNISVLHGAPGLPGLSTISVIQSQDKAASLDIASTVTLDAHAMLVTRCFFWSPDARMIVLRSAMQGYLHA